MKYIEFKERFKNYLVFSLQDVRKHEPAFYCHRLNAWQKKGYLQKVVRGYYVFTGEVTSELDLFLIANRIYPPSYVSLESALSYYDLIPESVYGITSVGTRNTWQCHSPQATFSYRKITGDRMFGYTLLPHLGQQIKMAEAEKAVLDYCYFHPHLTSEADFAGLRLNADVFFSIIHPEKFWRYVGLFHQEALKNRIDRLWAHLQKRVAEMGGGNDKKDNK